MQTCRDESDDGDYPDKAAPPVAMRGGVSGIFLDFDLLPRLLERAETTGTRASTVANWSAYLDEAGFEDAHIDPDEFPNGMSVADCMAADAWRCAERMGLIESTGLTSDGREVAALAELEPERRRETLASMLAPRVERYLRGQGDLPIVDLLRRAAGALEKTTNLWARECPGLIPVEVGAIVYWACINRRRAEELVDNIVSWRDVAMHRYRAPRSGSTRGFTLTGFPSSTGSTRGSGKRCRGRLRRSWRSAGCCRTVGHCENGHGLGWLGYSWDPSKVSAIASRQGLTGGSPRRSAKASRARTPH